MSADAAGAPRREILHGWGRTAPTAARLRTPRHPDEVARHLARAGERGALPRGLGRSYGDAAQNAGGCVLDMTALDGAPRLDAARGEVTVAAGTSLDALMRAVVPRGWFPAVVPGTRYVTVGGAIAADIHGKNHHVRGSFAQHVRELRLATPTGLHRLSPERDAEAFWATAGGMGLTGAVTAATLRLIPVATSRMVVETTRCRDLDAVMGRLVAADAEAPYSVAWLDLLAGGRGLGRGIVTEGRHAGRDELPRRHRDRPLAFDPGPLAAAPPRVPGGLLNRWTVRAFNEAWFRRAPRRPARALQRLSAYFHPLDAVAGWNRLYGPRGFVQYQLVLPEGREPVLRRIVEAAHGARLPSFLTVLKRFGPASPGPLSFPLAGWTLSLDVPASVEGLAGLLDDLDEQVAAAGGRVYLAKDGRLRPELVEVMYPRLDEWRAVRDRLDPDRRLCSDLARRLRLLGPGRPGPAT